MPPRAQGQRRPRPEPGGARRVILSLSRSDIEIGHAWEKCAKGGKTNLLQGAIVPCSAAADAFPVNHLIGFRMHASIQYAPCISETGAGALRKRAWNKRNVFDYYQYPRLRDWHDETSFKVFCLLLLFERFGPVQNCSGPFSFLLNTALTAAEQWPRVSLLNRTGAGTLSRLPESPGKPRIFPARAKTGRV